MSSRLVAVIVAGSFFMELLDGTVITTALPGIAGSFRVGAVDAGLGVTAYLLTVAVMIPLSGWLSDRFGARRVFCVAIVVFTLASVLCAGSQTLWEFVLARVVQGVGGAMMVPVGRTVVLRGAAKADLMAATAIITWPALIAPVLGPPVGGVIATYASWRWIFLINVPLGLVALVSALLVIKPSQRQLRPFDGLGFALSAVAIACLVYGMDLAGGATNWLLTAGVLILGLAVGAVAVRHARRHPTPMLDLSPLRIRTYTATSAEGSLLRLAINMVPFLLPLLFQVGFGLSAVTSGLLVLTVFAGNLVMKTITTPTVRRFGFRRVLVGNGILVALSLAACALFSASTPYALIVVVCFLGGAFRSLEFTGVNTLAFADVPAESMSAASTLNATITQLATGMGVAVAATVVHVEAGGGVPSVLDFRVGFLVGAAIALVGALLFLRLDRDAGAVVSAGRAKAAAR
ncbi:MFS transporter [Kutzneria buriramensis]|uniref:EmrB/QacA subfamily drug resistance transporter n=1 Tax=Kutzneria buriramensis TaxID=1045776 RepID=A0A3E0H127_9PSEU|nr:MFS transporter [Kutzneria buriramensis]REH35263.1 EmrB/QacA subfamily drug resistance transporter [Kutzneria buriramensis]